MVTTSPQMEIKDLVFKKLGETYVELLQRMHMNV